MNFKIIISTGLLFAASLGFAQNKSNGIISTTITPQLLPFTSGSPILNSEAFRFREGLITQLDSGTGFDFTTSSQWSSLGRLTTPGQTLYGLRVQRAGKGLLFGYTGASQTLTGAPTSGSPLIQWVGDSGVPAGDLQFRTSASSTSTISTNVLTLRDDATALLGTTSRYEDGELPEFAYGSNSYSLPKLEINQANSEGIAVITNNTTNSFGRGAIFINQNSVSGGQSFGSSNYALSNGGTSYGLRSRAENYNNAGSTYGLLADAASGNNNYGVYASAVSAMGTTNIGVYGRAFGGTASSTINYGVYGSASGFNPFAGYFAGRIFSTNNLVVSDKSLKTDIKKEEKVLDKISALNPVNYKFLKQDKEMNLTLPENLQHGFIAQELEEVFPELVEEVTHPLFNDKGEQTGTKTLKSVNYIGLISVLTESIKELQEEVSILKSQLAQNEKTYVVNNNSKLSTAELDAIVANGYYLGQNTPNPFTDTTTIEYSLPENEKSASIWILNLNGQTIKEFRLSESKGSVVISAGLLQKGIYLYTLLSGGQEIITKKMIVN